MIKEGFIDVLFAGNALAVHDIEYGLYGTSLGVDIKTGRLAEGGHRHHLYAINEVMKAGGIKELVDSGNLKEGVMYECIKNNVPFVLAGSIRDDGPLPEVITDVIEAQRAMRRHLKGVELVLMLCTLLHSVAVGNLLPSKIKTIFVDINPATVTKLADRGTAQALGVITDVGSFLPLLESKIKEMD
jgi:lysine-ketoglutarate reductase/saccharopine dehydrogenase-like protein (TIGR00300 family)